MGGKACSLIPQEDKGFVERRFNRCLSSWKQFRSLNRLIYVMKLINILPSSSIVFRVFHKTYFSTLPNVIKVRKSTVINHSVHQEQVTEEAEI